MIHPTRRYFVLAVIAGVVGLGGLACGGTETARIPGEEEETGPDDGIVRDDDEGPIPAPGEARTALNDALQAFNDHCLIPAAQRNTSYPISFPNPNLDDPSPEYRELKALADAGVLSLSREKGERGLSIHRFSLTPEGRRAQQQVALGRGYEPMFCYAVPRVAGLDSIKAVYHSGPSSLAKVWFGYQYENVQNWAESAAVQRVFSVSSVPSPNQRRSTDELLIQVDTTWIDRRLSGYGRHADGSTSR